MNINAELKTILTVAKWEVIRFRSTMSREIIPLAIVLFAALILVSGAAQQSGIHLEDSIYKLGTDSDLGGMITGGDIRFDVYKLPRGTTAADCGGAFDLLVLGTKVYAADTDRGRAALLDFESDYNHYKITVFNRQTDLYAAYPLLIDEIEVESKIDFTATQMGQMAFSYSNPFRKLSPSVLIDIEPPDDEISISMEELREQLIKDENSNQQLTRYTDVLKSSDLDEIPYKVPAQLSASLPFDTIILVFVFIFPLYFTSQFYMMSIMNERLERRGEILLSAPVRPRDIILGKCLPYFILMFIVAAAVTILIKADLIILLPLIPVILFFLASALLIGMISRSFKELSFISIFFSTAASAYLFFPAIFANIHVISQISPLTLIIFQMQGDGFTPEDYFYSTALFFVVSIAIFILAAKNFNEEKLFRYGRIIPSLVEFIGSAVSKRYMHISLFAVAGALIPFVFILQMMFLVVLFNIPMPLSVILIMLSAALIEECAKIAGIYAAMKVYPEWFTWKNLLTGSFAAALGFLIGEKLMLLATLEQISDSVFGAVLFTSMQAMWIPLSLHFATILIAASLLKKFGRRVIVAALLLTGIIHCLYNLFILGVLA